MISNHVKREIWNNHDSSIIRLKDSKSVASKLARGIWLLSIRDLIQRIT